MHHRMTRLSAGVHLRNHIQRIAGGPDRHISEYGIVALPALIAVAAQAVLILIHGRSRWSSCHPRQLPWCRFARRESAGGTLNDVTCCEPCAVVAIDTSRMPIVIQHRHFPRHRAGCCRWEDGWLILLYSAKTLDAAGEMFDPPLWQAMHSASLVPRNRRCAPAALCVAWQEVQALAATVP